VALLREAAFFILQLERRAPRVESPQFDSDSHTKAKNRQTKPVNSRALEVDDQRFNNRLTTQNKG
jgi:hypothetical protein